MRTGTAKRKSSASEGDWSSREQRQQYITSPALVPDRPSRERRMRTASEARMVSHANATRKVELRLKRLIDVVGAAILLLFLAPALMAIAVTIKATSRGPVLFRQQRYGLGSARFEILKFRTMFVAVADPSGIAQTRAGDPRVTPVGRVLRRSSLDELPQLWNVLRGDMSLVGPRPHVPGMLAGGKLYEELVPYYFERHSMPVGITGLAQVSGFRGSTVDPRVASGRIDKDLEYIRHWSIALDLWILWETCKREFLNGQGE